MEELLNRVVCGDCLEVMKRIPDNSIDLVVTDPPYGINYHSNYGSKEYRDKIHNHTWDTSFDFSKYHAEMFRILKNNSWMFVFGRIENFEIMRKLGFNRLLVWNKHHCGMGDLSDFGIGYEFIYVFKKGRPLLLGNRINGIIDYKHIGYFEKTLHPTQKPEGLIKILIEKTIMGGASCLTAF